MSVGLFFILSVPIPTYYQCDTIVEDQPKHYLYSMSKPYQVGYFEGEAQASFQLWRGFDTEDEARDFVQYHYYEGQDEEWPQNVAILYQGRIIFDGRFLQLN